MSDRAEQLGLVMPDSFELDVYERHRVLVDLDGTNNDPIEECAVLQFPAIDVDTGQDLGLDALTSDWLRYRTFTDDVGSTNEADKYRFEDPEEIRTKFLKDRGGRTLFTAVNKETKHLDAVCWFHVIQGDEFDYKLLEAAEGVEGKPVLASAVASELGTIAVRTYSSATPNLGPTLLNVATEQYFKANPSIAAVVGRFSSQHRMVRDIGESMDGIVSQHPYTAISSGEGFVVLAALRDPVELDWKVDPEHREM